MSVLETLVMKRDKLDRRREGLNLAAKIRTLWMERFAQDLFHAVNRFFAAMDFRMAQPD